MNHQPDELLLRRNAKSPCLLSGYRRAYVHVPDDLPRRPFQGEGQDIGGAVGSLVLGVEPPHGTRAKKGDGKEGVPAFAPENGLNYAADQRAGQRQAASVDHYFTHASAGWNSGVIPPLARGYPIRLW